MHKEFYENIIAEAEDLGQLRIIHKFLVSDMSIHNSFQYLKYCISKKEAAMLLDMQISTMPLNADIKERDDKCLENLSHYPLS